MTTTTELETAKAKLAGLLSDTDTIYTVLRSVSKSGLSQSISFHLVDNNKNIVNINYYISVILGYKFSKSLDGLKIEGCGMDRGFDVVYTLSRALGITGKLSHRWI